MNTNGCVHNHEDGCGNYCKAVDMRQMLEAGRIDEEYPHKYWRTDCYGDFAMCPFKVLFKAKEKSC